MKIILENINKTFDDKVVLENVNLTLDNETPTALMGISGVGKTTLTRILLGLEKADSGEIHIPEGMKSACVFQENRLIEDISLINNILMVSGKAKTGEAVRLIERLELAEHADKHVRVLSGGQKRRTAIIRALLSDYDFMILDEPFNGLDGEIKKKTAELINECTKGKILLLVTHSEEEAELFGCKVFRL